MAEDFLAIVPPFLSPLNHEQHARLGRIAILWGQIDMILDHLLDIALGITVAQRQTLIGEKPIGAKLGMLSQHLNDLPANARPKAKEFWDLANQTKPQRNRCFHGVWGYRCYNGQKVVPAASHYKAGDDALRVTQLPALEKKLCITARVGMDALVILREFKRTGATRLFHGRGETVPPWLIEWSAQRPADDDALDRRWKRGQLPYLKQPL